MLRPIDYEEYHRIYSDHLMADVDNPPTTRVVEVEYYNRDIKWFEATEFNVLELCQANNVIRMVTIS